MKTFNDLPFELIEFIAAYLPVQSYYNLRECCRMTAQLNRVAKLTFKAYKESAIGWTAPNGRIFKAFFPSKGFFAIYINDYIRKRRQSFFNNVLVCVKDYSPTVFVWMCKNNVGDQAMRMIRFDPTLLAKTEESCKIYSFKRACEFGFLDIFETLLQDPLVDPSLDDNFAICEASRYGHSDVVQLLLQDPRVNPSAGNNYAIRCSSKNGHLDVVQLLLQDSRVDPSAGRT